MVVNMSKPQFGDYNEFVNSYAVEGNTAARSKEYFGDVIENGVRFNARNLGQIDRMIQAKAIEAGELKNNEITMLRLPTPIIDDLVAKTLVGTPVVLDAANNPGEVVESFAKAEEAFAKAIGATSLHIVGLDGKDSLMKTLTAQSPFIHAVADYDVSVLYKRAYPFQASLPTEAVRGKDVVWDVIPPYGLGSAYFDVEDPMLYESDFPQYTRNEYVKFSYSVGRITDAALKLGRSAYPARDFMSLATDTHFDAMRSLRERRLLGVNNDVQSFNFTYQPAGPLEYKGIHELITNTTTPLSAVVDGSGIYTGTQSEKEQFQALDTLANTVAIKMAISGMQPNLALCDPNTFALIRKGILNITYQVPPNAAAVYGVTAIQWNLQGLPPLNLVSHPFLPRNSGQSALYLIDTNMLAQRVAWRDTMEFLAKTNPSQKFFMSDAMTLIDKSDKDGHSSLMGMVKNITHSQVA